MPRALHPHTPDDDLQALNALVGGTAAHPVLTPDIISFCESGVSVIIALGGRDAAPVAGMGSGCRMLQTGRMRLLLPGESNRSLLEAAAQGEPVAVTFSQPVTHRSIQVKGVGTAVVEPTDHDRLEAIRQLAGLSEELREIDFTSPFTDAYCHVDEDGIAAIEFDPLQVFVQTPGPGAGAELKR